MTNIELEVRADLIRDLRRLADLHYGDIGEEGLSRVVEAAIEMRLLWTHLVEIDGTEVEEPVTTWQFAEDKGNVSLPEGITDWMFKRGAQ